MIRVVPKRGEPIQVTLRRLRKLCEREGLIREVRSRMYYEKPSERRRREKLRSIKRCQKEEMEKNTPQNEG